jgi:hypothetical protein
MQCRQKRTQFGNHTIQSVADEEAYATLSEVTKTAAKNNTKKSLKFKSNLTIFISYTQHTSQTSYYKR